MRIQCRSAKDNLHTAGLELTSRRPNDSHRLTPRSYLSQRAARRWPSRRTVARTRRTRGSEKALHGQTGDARASRLSMTKMMSQGRSPKCRQMPAAAVCRGWRRRAAFALDRKRANLRPSPGRSPFRGMQVRLAFSFGRVAMLVTVRQDCH